MVAAAVVAAAGAVVPQPSLGPEHAFQGSLSGRVGAGHRRIGSHAAQFGVLDWNDAGPALDPAAGAAVAVGAVAVGAVAVALVELAVGAVAAAAAGQLDLGRRMDHLPQSPQPSGLGSSASSAPVADP